jgi:hypothetical protein
MDLKFNIIFVPGTVRYLRLGVLSLLKHSSYRYCLVANGLGEEERSMLERLCHGSERLEYFYYPSKEVMNHGTILNILFQRENSEYFCMADSDIFAAGPFEEELEKQLQECDVLSSGLPLDMSSTDVLPGFHGKCLQTPSGLPLAPTFLSVYRVGLFRKIILETKIGFEKYHPSEYLPESVKQLDLPDNLQEPRFIDTGKLLNILASRYGARFRHFETSNLIHIGGISDLRGSWKDKIKEGVRELFKRPYVFGDKCFQSEMRRRSKGKTIKALRDKTNASNADADLYLYTRTLRKPLAIFFTHFFRSLFDGTPEPVFELNDEHLRQSIDRIAQLIRELYFEEYGSQKK